MDLKRLVSAPGHSAFADLALLLARGVAGAAFVLHGWMKVQTPFSWMGPEAPVPAILQALAALSEFGGGLAWILGLLTPLASLGIACTMAGAFAFHTLSGDPFVPAGPGPSSELAAVFFCLALLLGALGPGRFSLDRALFGGR